MLPRYISAFPGGWPGIALFLMRAVLASTLLLQGVYYFLEPNPTPATSLVGLVAVVSGALMLVGFLTPVIAAVVALAGTGVALSVFPACTRSLFQPFVALEFAVAILLAILILGPGAFSVDARLFGRREIIIPLQSPARR